MDERGAVGGLVVVGVDGSSASDAAVVQAAREAQRRRARLRVVHAFRWPVAPLYVPLDPEPLNHLAQEPARLARSVAPDLDVTGAVMIGGAVSVLAGESRAADLLVVGSRGTGGFLGMLLGSTAQALAAHGECPVLVIRAEPRGTGPVVVAVDGTPGGEAAVEFAFAEAALRATDLVALHAWLPESADGGAGAETSERVVAQVLAGRRERYPDVAVRTELVRGEPREVLIEASRTAQLMVVGARGRGGFTGLLLGSVSQALLHHAHSPVVVARTRT